MLYCHIDMCLVALWLSILESSSVNTWKLNILVNKILVLQSIPQLQFRICLAIELLLTPDEEQPMEDEEKSYAERDRNVKRRNFGQQYVAGQNSVLTHL